MTRRGLVFNKNRKVVLLFVGFLLVLLIMEVRISGITGESTKDTLVYALPYDLTSEYSERSVFTQQSYASAQWMNAVFTGLYSRENGSHEFVPVLADGPPTVQVNGTDFISSEIAMKITVRLKDGLKFSDGTPLTVDDVVYTYQMLLMPKVNVLRYGTWTYYYKNNASIVKVDEHTVEFDVRVFYFQYYWFINAWILPQEIYQPAIDQGIYDFEDDVETYMIGAGPFKLETFDTANEQIVLKRNTNYVGSEPWLETLIFKKIESKASAIQAFIDGEVQLVDAQYVLSADDLVAVPNRENSSTLVAELSWREMAYNHFHPVYGDTAQQDVFIGQTWDYSGGNSFTVSSFWKEQGVNDEATRREKARLVRHAMDTVVPREQIVNELLDGMGIPLATIWPTVAIGYDPSIHYREFSIDAARSLMTQVGFNYTDLTYDSEKDTCTTFFFNVTFMIPPSTLPHTHWATLIRENFEKIGIGVDWFDATWNDIVTRLNPTEFNNPIPIFDEGGYDIFFGGHLSGIDFDPWGLYETYNWVGVGGFNFYNWYDESYDDLSEEYGKTLDRASRITIAHEIQQYFFTNTIVSAIFEPASRWVFDPKLKGLDFILLNMASLRWEYVGYAPPTHATEASSENAGSFLPGLTVLGMTLSFMVITLIVKRRKN